MLLPGCSGPAAFPWGECLRTIGRTYTGPSRNWAEACDVCGVEWHRSEMTRLEDGVLVCPDDRDGKTTLELDREYADNARARVGIVRPKTRDY